VPLSGGAGLRLGFKEPSIPAWVIIAAVSAVALLCLACVDADKKKEFDDFFEEVGINSSIAFDKESGFQRHVLYND